MDPEKLYRVYSNHLKQRYGEKVYKLPVNIPCSCPNRDGTKGIGGCIYCGASGSGYELLSLDKTVSEQLEENSLHIGKKYNAKKYIAYFQSFSNTWLRFDDFRRFTEEAASFRNVVELAISTRPDCLLPKHLEHLNDLKIKYGVKSTIELGLQSANNRTLTILNRQHSVEDFLKASEMVKSYRCGLCAHVITDLPWDSKEDIQTMAEVLNQSGTDYLKIHSLYVEKGTALARMYQNGLELLPSEAFIERTISLLERVNPEMIIERLIGRIPEENCLYANWQRSWWKIRDELLERMIKKETYQGKKYKREHQSGK